MQLQPNESYPITHGIGNHLDTGTYYVQTKIYNSDNVLIGTVNLTDQGGNNFLKNWWVPYDNVYQRGKWIYMITSVYTDSGYTTKSNKYADEYSGAILVQERISFQNLASIGGGAGIDYKELRKVIKEEIKGNKDTKQKDNGDKELIKNITDSVVKRLPPYPKPEKVVIPPFPEIPKPEKVDLSKIEKSISEVKKEIKSRPVFEKTKITDIIDEVRSTDENIQNSIKDILEAIDKKMNLNIDVVGGELTSKRNEDLVKLLKAKYKI